jgi:hypothetical protein
LKSCSDAKRFISRFSSVGETLTNGTPNFLRCHIFTRVCTNSLLKREGLTLLLTLPEMLLSAVKVNRCIQCNISAMLNLSTNLRVGLDGIVGQWTEQDVLSSGVAYRDVRRTTKLLCPLHRWRADSNSVQFSGPQSRKPTLTNMLASGINLGEEKRCVRRVHWKNLRKLLMTMMDGNLTGMSDRTENLLWCYG